MKLLLIIKQRIKIIMDKIKSICKTRSCKELIDQSLLLEVSNLVDNPRIILAKFDKRLSKITSRDN